MIIELEYSLQHAGKRTQDASWSLHALQEIVKAMMQENPAGYMTILHLLQQRQLPVSILQLNCQRGSPGSG